MSFFSNVGSSSVDHTHAILSLSAEHVLRSEPSTRWWCTPTAARLATRLTAMSICIRSVVSSTSCFDGEHCASAARRRFSHGLPGTSTSRCRAPPASPMIGRMKRPSRGYGGGYSSCKLGKNERLGSTGGAIRPDEWARPGCADNSSRHCCTRRRAFWQQGARPRTSTPPSDRHGA